MYCNSGGFKPFLFLFHAYLDRWWEFNYCSFCEQQFKFNFYTIEHQYQHYQGTWKCPSVECWPLHFLTLSSIYLLRASGWKTLAIPFPVSLLIWDVQTFKTQHEKRVTECLYQSSAVDALVHLLVPIQPTNFLTFSPLSWKKIDNWGPEGNGSA